MTALGPLGLTHEDLWHITTGEIQDLVIAHNYQRHLKRREDYILASLIGAAMGSKYPSMDEVCGRWLDNRVMEPEEANEYVLELARRRSEK